MLVVLHKILWDEDASVGDNQAKVRLVEIDGYSRTTIAFGILGEWAT